MPAAWPFLFSLAQVPPVSLGCATQSSRCRKKSLALSTALYYSSNIFRTSFDSRCSSDSHPTWNYHRTDFHSFFHICVLSFCAASHSYGFEDWEDSPLGAGVFLTHTEMWRWLIFLNVKVLFVSMELSQLTLGWVGCDVVVILGILIGQLGQINHSSKLTSKVNRTRQSASKWLRREALCLPDLRFRMGSTFYYDKVLLFTTFRILLHNMISLLLLQWAATSLFCPPDT